MVSRKDHTPRPNSLFEGDGVDLSPKKAWPPKSPMDNYVLRAQGSSLGPSEGAAIYPCPEGRTPQLSLPWYQNLHHRQWMHAQRTPR